MCQGYVIKQSMGWCYKIMQNSNWTGANETCTGDNSGRAALLNLDTEHEVAEMLAHLPIGNTEIRYKSHCTVYVFVHQHTTTCFFI